MVKAIVIHKTGGPDVMSYEDVDLPPPGPGQVRIKQHAIGVNYIDIYIRSGMYPNQTPSTLGNEGAGEGTALGQGAQEGGAQHIIYYRDEDFVARVKDITKGALCEVVYDGVGKTTFPGSLDCLKPFGYFVSFGSSSGQIDAFNINVLAAKGSLYATRPTMNTHVAKRDVLNEMAADLFEVVSSGKVKILIHNRYKL